MVLDQQDTIRFDIPEPADSIGLEDFLTDDFKELREFYLDDSVRTTLVCQLKLKYGMNYNVTYNFVESILNNVLEELANLVWSYRSGESLNGLITELLSTDSYNLLLFKLKVLEHSLRYDPDYIHPTKSTKDVEVTLKIINYLIKHIKEYIRTTYGNKKNF